MNMVDRLRRCRLPSVHRDSSRRDGVAARHGVVRVLSSGFSVMELMLVITVIGILAAITVPAAVRSRARADLHAARNALASAIGLARQVATQYGRLGQLHIDPDRNVFWVTVDTGSAPGQPVQDTVGEMVHVGPMFGGVRLRANRRLLCFNSRGLGTAAGDCELPNATIVFERLTLAETLTVSRLGRTRKR